MCRGVGGVCQIHTFTVHGGMPEQLIVPLANCSVCGETALMSASVCVCVCGGGGCLS